MLLHVAGKERERDITVNAKRRKDWTAEQRGQAWGCQKSHLLGISPLLITVLLLSTPNSGDCLLEKVGAEPGEIFGTSRCDCLTGAWQNSWRGGTGDVTGARLRNRGTEASSLAAHVVIWDL